MIKKEKKYFVIWWDHRKNWAYGTYSFTDVSQSLSIEKKFTLSIGKFDLL